jgi:negative regulator of flagellin synthesis FlgM
MPLCCNKTCQQGRAIVEIKKTVSTLPPAAPTKDATSPAAQNATRAPAGGASRAGGATGEPALSVQALQQTLVAQPEPVDTARVEAIRTAIREGRLQINPEGIADAALRAAFELLDKGSSPR